MNLPNKITISRIVLIPVFIALYYLTQIPHNFLYAAIVFALAAFTDFLDGYIARKYNLVTDFGKFLDPIADKVLVLAAFSLMLTSAGGGILPAISGGIGVSIILAREFIVASFRMVAASKNVVIAADGLGKLKTVTQDVCVLFLLVAKAFEGVKPFGGELDFFVVVYYIGFALYIASVILTAVSGVSYVVKNRAVLSDNVKE